MGVRAKGSQSGDQGPGQDQIGGNGSTGLNHIKSVVARCAREAMHFQGALRLTYRIPSLYALSVSKLIAHRLGLAMIFGSITFGFMLCEIGSRQMDSYMWSMCTRTA